MSIKYYRLAKDEELPDEFCAVRDVDGEPSEYVFYVPESDVAKLQELITNVHEALCADKAGMFHKLILASMEDDMRELGVGVEVV